MTASEYFNNLTKKRQVVKIKLNHLQQVFGAWTSIPNPQITEIMVRSGVDFVGIDMEHSTASQDHSQRIISACHEFGSLCFVRVASHNMEMIKRVLDSGADGIIVPMVNTADEAEKIISWFKFPPVGKRSFGVARAQGYGFDFDDYVNSWNCASSLIVQIESIEGVENIEGILSFKEIDGVMIGPYDMSGSIGYPGQLTHPKIIEAERKVIAACKNYKKSCGTHLVEADEKSIKTAFEMGYNFVILSSDVFLLWKWSERINHLIGSIPKIPQ